MSSHKQPTAHASKLFTALIENGIPAQCECSDKHKTVDICIKSAGLYIEVDGLPHVTQARQIEKDFERDYYSLKDGFDTLRIANLEIEQDLPRIVKAICTVVGKRTHT